MTAAHKLPPECWVIEQRRESSALPMVRGWTECAGSYSETPEERDAAMAWWRAYDSEYGLVGWEYRARQVKERNR